MLGISPLVTGLHVSDSWIRFSIYVPGVICSLPHSKIANIDSMPRVSHLCGISISSCDSKYGKVCVGTTI